MFQQHLTTHEIPSTRIRAIQHLNEDNYSLDEYNDRLEEFGIDVKITNFHQAKYTYLYIIQQAFTGHINVELAYTQAENFIKNNAWSFTTQESQDPEKVQTVVDKHTGHERKKKGWKKIEAVKKAREIGIDKRSELIEFFIKSLDMTDQGALTYYHIVKKELKNG